MAFTGNSSYQPQYTAFAVGKAVDNAWIDNWTSAHPILSSLKAQGMNWNVFNSDGAGYMNIPVVGAGPTTAVSGITDANELVARTLAAVAGVSHAQYAVTHYSAPMTFTQSEQKIGDKGYYGKLLDVKVKQLVGGFKERMSIDLGSTTVDSRAKLMGVYYALSTSNTVGGISQSTDTNWAAQVSTSAGTFALALVDAKFDQITSTGNTPDLVLAGLSAGASGVNVFGKFRTAIGPNAERIVNNNGKKPDYGFASFYYMNMDVVMDNRVPDNVGYCAVLTTNTWYCDIPETMERTAFTNVPGTDALVQAWTCWCSFGTSSPRANGLVTGIS